ncbi:hypothetical protein E2P81_ATG09353 [Venturia nashicola]|nr:hypothetical protein E2P81_ATG09353 [Venturia nashicola]
MKIFHLVLAILLNFSTLSSAAPRCEDPPSDCDYGVLHSTWAPLEMIITSLAFRQSIDAEDMAMVSAHTRANTNYGMLLVNKVCCAEFLETMTVKDHARYVFHVSLERSTVFAKYCDNLDSSTLGYRCKIIIDYDGNPLDIADSNNVVVYDKYRDLVKGLLEFVVFIPNSWPVILHLSELSDESELRRWMPVVVAVLDNFLVSPPGYIPLADVDDHQVTLETHLVTKPLDILGTVATIRSVRICVWNAIHRLEHRFERTVDNGTFERILCGGQLDEMYPPRVLLLADEGYRFCIGTVSKNISLNFRLSICSRANPTCLPGGGGALKQTKRDISDDRAHEVVSIIVVVIFSRT